MADEDDSSVRSPSTAPAGESIALTAASAAKADAYLEEQIRLARLQSQNMIEQNAFELSHLRWRRFNDQMKGAMQIMVVAIGAVVVIALGAAMWNASRADGIVVEAFSVPPAFAADGLGGDIVADDLTNKIAAIRDTASGNSFARSKDVHNDRDEDITVEIPETGISFAQVWRYLKGWLGNERPLRGNIRRTADNKIALTAVLAGDGAATFTGPAADLDRLEQQAAEHVFASVDPNNYVLYLDGMGRDADAYAAVSKFAQAATDPVDRAGFTSLWSAMTRGVIGNVPLSVARARYSLALNPRMVVSHREIMAGDQVLGHDEDALAEAQTLLTSEARDYPPAMQGEGVTQIHGVARLERDMATGDFLHAREDLCFYCSAPDSLLQRAEFAARLHDVAAARFITALALVSGEVSPAARNRTRIFADAATGDWHAAAADSKAYSDAILGITVGAHHNTFPSRYRALKALTFAAPLHAEALALSGDFKAAHAAIDATPRDCYQCVRVRGVVAALQKNWHAADAWFAAAVKQAPSLPFAYVDWGRMLLAKGDYDGAIAKLALAHQKGPNFADPLELWGEVLMLQNRSDLALAKFEEASRYAPNWGRLHLKWGEALAYAGHNDEARKQFARAAALFLTPSEKSERARVEALHG